MIASAILCSVRCHVVAFRLLPRQPRSENPARPHEGAHEERISRGQVLGTASARRKSAPSRFAVASPTRGGSKAGQWFQRNAVVLHQRRHRGGHKILTGHQSVLLSRKSRRLRESGRSSVS